MSHEVSPEEKELLETLVKRSREIHSDRWKGALKRGIKIPEKGLEQVSDEEEAIENLKSKGLLERKEEKVEHDSGLREVTYTEDDEGKAEREIENKGYIRGEKRQEKLKIPEEKIQKVLQDLEV